STSNVSVHSGDTLCITGSNITVSFASASGGLIRVCGTNVTIQNLNLGAGTALLITTAGSAILSGVNYNASSALIQNDGALSGILAVGGVFTNNGSYTCAGDFNLNSSAGTFTNNGTMTISGAFNNSSSFTASNNGHITVAGNFQQN